MAKKPEEEFNPWIEIDPVSLCLYTLPAGVVANYEHKDEKEQSAEYWSIFIGTNNGIYYVFAPINKRGFKPSEAKFVGLRGMNIVRIEQRQQEIFAHTDQGKVHRASSLSLRGMR